MPNFYRDEGEEFSGAGEPKDNGFGYDEEDERAFLRRLREHRRREDEETRRRYGGYDGDGER